MKTYQEVLDVLSPAAREGEVGLPGCLKDGIGRLCAEPLINGFFNAFPRMLAEPRIEPAKEHQRVFRSVVGDAAPGSAYIPSGVIPASAMFDLLANYGAWATLGKHFMPLPTTKFPYTSALPEAWFYMSQATQRDADTAFAGSATTATGIPLQALLPISRDLLLDQKIDVSKTILELLIRGLGYRLDYACFRGDATEDGTNGGMTGLFEHGDVTDVVAATGNVTVKDLEADDFANTIAGVATAALQRPCRWWINPAFLPELLRIQDGGQRLLQLPRAEGDAWMLFGFPVTWTVVAPSTNTAGNKVAVFGDPESFLVGLRSEFEFLRSDSKFFDYNWVAILAGTYAKGVLRDATGFARLKLAAT